MASSGDNDEELLNLLRSTFSEEALEFIGQAEESLLALSAGDAEIERNVDAVFRAYHSIKGSAASVGFQDVASFSHVAEDYLTELRDAPHAVESHVVTLLLEVNDALRDQIEALSQGLTREASSYEPLLDRVREAANDLGGQSGSGRAADTSPGEAGPSAAAETEASTAAPHGHEASDDIWPEDDVGAADAPPTESRQTGETTDARTGDAEMNPDDTDMNLDHAGAKVVPLCEAQRDPGKQPETEGETLEDGDHVTAPSAAKATAGPAASGKTSQTQPQNSAPLKVDSKRLDDVMGLVGELVVLKSQLLESLSNHSGSQRTDSLVSLLDKTVRDIHEKTLAMRMTSLRQLFVKMQRTARDLSSSLEKPVNFSTSGEDTELDKILIDSLASPLVHLVRNAIDHGLETADYRAAAGKPEVAEVRLQAYQRGEHVIIEITDDGGGLDKEKIFEKAKARGLISEGTDITAMTDGQVHDLIFQPGFSTAQQVTDVSGRGVGLDSVQECIREMKGRIELESRPGQGTTARIIVPLTTAITDGIIVVLGNRRYILPVESVKTFLEPKAVKITALTNGQRIVDVGGRHLPLIALSETLGDGAAEGGLVVVAEALGESLAFLVDNVLGKTQVVLKPLGKALKNHSSFAGAAVLGDGAVALVLDVAGLTQNVDFRTPHEQEAA